MLDGDAVTKIADLAQAALEAGEHLTEVGERTYSTKALHLIEEPAENWPAALEVAGLDGLLDYVQENPDEIVLESAILHIVGPREVRVMSKVIGEPHRRQRQTFAVAKATDLTAGFFGQYLPVEEMVIALQTRFEDGGDRSAALKLLGNVKDEELATQADDGISQKVTVRAGASFVEMERVPNPVILHPFRTFPEIDPQPASPFVLRLKRGHGGGGIQAAFFEADAGAWRQSAIEDIREHLVGSAEGDLPTILA